MLRDVEPFPLADAVFQFVGLAYVLFPGFRLAGVGVNRAHAGVDPGEVRVELDSPAIERQRCQFAAVIEFCISQGKRLERIERCRCHLLDGHIELLHRGQRLT